MRRHLLDPELFILPDDSTLEQEAAHWNTLANWSVDPRVGLGTDSMAFIVGHFQRYGWPNEKLETKPPAMREDVNRLLGRLLARILPASQDVAAGDSLALDPEHVSNSGASTPLHLDIRNTFDEAGSVEAIASASSHWAIPTAERVTISPPPPSSLLLTFQPGMELETDVDRSIRAACQEMRIHIVGGQENAETIAQLGDQLGISAGSITWHVSERKKPARDIKQRWANLDSARDITICIVGRVGHATSKSASDAASKRSIRHLEVHRENDVVPELRKLILELMGDA